MQSSQLTNPTLHRQFWVFTNEILETFLSTTILSNLEKNGIRLKTNIFFEENYRLNTIYLHLHEYFRSHPKLCFLLEPLNQYYQQTLKNPL